jgi:hypothetical protein
MTVASTTATESVTATLPSRRCFIVHQFRDDYGISVENRESSDTVDAASVVASNATRTEEDTATGRDPGHLPALDIDEAIYVVDTLTGTDVWLDIKPRRRQMRKLNKLLFQLGLGCSEVPRSALTAKARTDQWNSSRTNCRDATMLSDVLASIGPNFNGDFASLMAVAESTTDDSTMCGPDLDSPWVLHLRCPVRLLKSTHNHHLYLEHLVPWPKYKELLKLLVKTGIIEKGYYRASVARTGTHLRLPWIQKPGSGGSEM